MDVWISDYLLGQGNMKENLTLAIVFDIKLTYCFHYTSVCILDVFISQFLRLCLYYLIICSILKSLIYMSLNFTITEVILPDCKVRCPENLTVLQKPIEGCNHVSNFYTSHPKSFLFSDQALLISLYHCLTLRRTMFYMYFSV